MLTLAVIAGAVVVAGAAGFARDRLMGRRTPPQPTGKGFDDPTLRYYRDVGNHDNQNNNHWGGPGPVL